MVSRTLLAGGCSSPTPLPSHVACGVGHTWFTLWQRVIPGPEPEGAWPTGWSIFSQVGAARRSRQEAWRAEFQLDGSANSKGATDA
jgi:hypothetical protein